MPDSAVAKSLLQFLYARRAAAAIAAGVGAPARALGGVAWRKRPSVLPIRATRRGVEDASGGLHNPEGAFPMGLWQNSV
jgi:hypothetical protein